jgi:hypothetical protein
MRFLNDDRVVDTSEAKRSLEVICAGLPRCATSSLQAALESDIMGFDPCMHMAHVLPHPARAQLCIDAMLEKNRERRMKIVQKLFGGYAATADFPGFIFTDELMDLYPDAKIVLNKRKDGQVWAKSITGTIKWFSTTPYLMLCGLWSMHRKHYFIHQSAQGLTKQKYGFPLEFTPEFYDAYNAWVLAEAKKRGREVLEWEVSEGWAPLCKFLGKDLPPEGTEFPHVNDQATMRTLALIFRVQGVVSWLAVGGCIWASWKYGPELVTKLTPILKAYLPM